MSKKDKCLKEINEVETELKRRVRELWTAVERKKIKERGEEDADFYQIWYKLCKLETITSWVNNYGYLTRSQKHILKEYRHGRTIS